MKGLILVLLLLIAPFANIKVWSQQTAAARNGSIKFVSNAPLEIISASSNELQGAVDLEKQTYLFVVNNATFQGFNSLLQQEHFHENYMESEKYPYTTFTGKIIEPLKPIEGTQQEVRAKGILDLHGVKTERIIRVTLHYLEKTIRAEADFTVLLDDHHMRIPKVVSKKIAPEIEVKVNINLVKQAGT